ncbi:alpha/beta hydrolase [Reinekea marinisedimentorum]|nr:alpha/beta hydrolase [Reinekea marinisedimentorum]
MKVLCRVGLLAVIVFISSCANKQVVLTPVEPFNAEQEHINLLTVSTRMETDEGGVLYNGERAEGFTIKAATVAIPLEHQLGEFSYSRKGTPDLSKDFAVTQIQSLQPGEVPDWFSEEQHTNKLFIFVHGFNVHYGTALYSLAQLSYDLKVEAMPVLFSWPSRGKLNSYLYDKESATISRDTLEMLLQMAADSDDIDEIAILAHSMGSWLTVEALRQMAIRNDGNVNPKITNVILASPDIGVDVFRSQMSALTGTRPFFTIVISSDDKALSLSRILAGDADRLGAIDVNEEKYRQIMQTNVEDLLVIDSTELKTRDKTRHLKFAESPLVLSTVSDTINDLEEERLTLNLADSILLSLSQSLERVEVLSAGVK